MRPGTGRGERGFCALPRGEARDRPNGDARFRFERTARSQSDGIVLVRLGEEISVPQRETKSCSDSRWRTGRDAAVGWQRRVGLCRNFVEGADEFVEFAGECLEATAAVATFDHGLGLLKCATDLVPLGVPGGGEHELE